MISLKSVHNAQLTITRPIKELCIGVLEGQIDLEEAEKRIDRIEELSKNFKKHTDEYIQDLKDFPQSSFSIFGGFHHMTPREEAHYLREKSEWMKELSDCMMYVKLYLLLVNYPDEVDYIEEEDKPTYLKMAKNMLKLHANYPTESYLRSWIDFFTFGLTKEKDRYEIER